MTLILEQTTMLSNGRRFLPFLLVLAVTTTGCENTPPAREVAIPPGVSLDPPRAEPVPGGLVLPGAEGDISLPATGTATDAAGATTDAAGAAVPDTAAPAPAPPGDY